MPVETDRDKEVRADGLITELADIRDDLERQGEEKGFDHKKTSLWKLTGALMRYFGAPQE